MSDDIVVDLYAQREKIYPREVKGYFQRLRSISVYVLLGIFYLTPWIPWGDRQAILFDLPARKFHIFGLTLWPQDFFLLTLLLILAGLSLFFFTALAGRVWCGYACPQTVWTEIFIRMERWVEGTRAQQMKLADAPWSLNKLMKRVTKQVLWISFALFTGLTFVGYFTPVRELVVQFFTLEIQGWNLFWVLFYGFATYGNAGFLREQVCQYMCPYARFQSAMFDDQTLIVAYDESRGEPRSRGKRRKESVADVGDCIDCGLCVQVCPTGIDIRDGLQYECIACAACIDACDEVMEKVGLEPKLIRYSSEQRDAGQAKGLLQTVLRPRILIYAAVLTAFMVLFATVLLSRSSFQVDVLRDRNALYQWNGEQLENSYLARIMNKSGESMTFSVDLQGLPGGEVRWGGESAGLQEVTVEAGEIGEFNLVVAAPGDKPLSSSTSVELSFVSSDKSDQKNSVSEDVRFLAPTN